MPKNKGKGGKNRRRGKNETDKAKRELMFKEDGQEYAQVVSTIHTILCVCMTTARKWRGGVELLDTAMICSHRVFDKPIVKMLGNGRLEAQCFDGQKRLANIRGTMRKKVWINQGDIILLSLRDYQDSKGDVILKYTADEARSLKAYGELPENAKINETDTYGGDGGEECNFEFADAASDEEEEETGDIDVDDI
ncbi:Eukaryotic translation initiation factor 1A [Ceratocystis fimbriata CBS 114723]|uniref:Eukaryotic translation initiation factor 1A n=1 Tax=Ceratocystis fimbriata CBS 114723 TaxID=1035309 RepID=A0A2C5XA80_9PEZI|nr:Eukaryotic translation initiation factor 1A [Ceratocystis fimbriata CBS 114723]